MPLCFSLLMGRGVLDEYCDSGEEHADSKDTARLGHFLEPLKYPSHDLLVAIWQDQYCVQGRIGRQRPKGSLHLLVHCLVETSATAEQHAGIRANPCLHLVARLSHASDTLCPWRFSRMSRRRRRRRARLCTKVETPSGPNLHVELCVADELLAHHKGAAFLIIMRLRFPSI